MNCVAVVPLAAVCSYICEELMVVVEFCDGGDKYSYWADVRCVNEC